MDFLIFIGVLVVIGAKIINATKEGMYNDKACRDSGDRIYYFDYRGIARFKPTGECCYISKLDNGDRVLMNMKTLKPIYNLTQAEIESGVEQRKREAIAQHKTVFVYDDRINRSKYLSENYIGVIYEDLKTGDRYVVRRIGHHRYYISLKTFDLVRRTDEDLETNHTLCDNKLSVNTYYSLVETHKKMNDMISFINNQAF